MTSRDGTGPKDGKTARDPTLRVDFGQIQAILPGLIDSLTDAVLVVDHRQRVVAANRRYVEAFGARRARIHGSICHDSLHCPDPGNPEAGCAACEALARREPVHVVRNLLDRPGDPRKWEGTFTPILNREGDVTYVVEVWRDVTERTRLESQVSHNERLASLGILAAGVGHEINNPLASMLAAAESLTRMIARGEFGPPAQQEAAEMLQLIEREIVRCRNAVDKLMLLAQPVSTAPADVDLNRVVRDTLSLLRHQTRRQGIEVVEHLEALPTIWARDSGIRGVCMNLMMNAVQAMASGGKLTITTRRNGSGVALTVEDTGPGIPPELMGRIWDPFFTTKPVGKGTGLGLSITNRIVHRHGGTIKVESEPGHGARFVVELPIAGTGGSDV